MSYCSTRINIVSYFIFRDLQALETISFLSVIPVFITCDSLLYVAVLNSNDPFPFPVIHSLFRSFLNHVLVPKGTSHLFPIHTLFSRSFSAHFTISLIYFCPPIFPPLHSPLLNPLLFLAILSLKLKLKYHSKITSNIPPTLIFVSSCLYFNSNLNHSFLNTLPTFFPRLQTSLQLSSLSLLYVIISIPYFISASYLLKLVIAICFSFHCS